jgi:DNA polymerase elongation subunit (family B)
MSVKEVYVYDHFEQPNGEIFLFALSQKGCNVCLRVDNFKPHIYIDTSGDQEIEEIVQEACQSLKMSVNTTFQRKKKLFYNHKKINSENAFVDTLYPYTKVEFKSTINMYMLCKYMRSHYPDIKVHEDNVPAILKMMTAKHMTPIGWAAFTGTLVGNASKKTHCKYEYIVKTITNPKAERLNTAVYPKVLSYDIEVYSSNENVMPQAVNLKDEIFQISASVSTKEGEYDNHLLTLGPYFEIENVTVHHFKTETELIIGFKNFIQKVDPNIICGYNIMGFDEGYLIDRARMNKCMNEYSKKGMIKNKECKESDIQWSSSAMSNRSFRFINSDGRIVVDLLEIIKRDYKFDNYKLSTVSKHFMNDTKTDLSVKGIFRAYRLGMAALREGATPSEIKTGVDAIQECGVYCIKDSVLVSDLFYKIQCWTQLSEMAVVCCVTIKDLITRGQQLKVFSQVYSICSLENIVVEKDGYIPSLTDKYEGAYVVEPVPGVYDNVVPFDFASLYPTTMIAYNICYSTLVTDPSISDKYCNKIEWVDETTGTEYKYRFLKSPRGILPRLLTNLLDARRNTRKIMKDCKDKEKLAILDKRQLAYKISSNSVYGSMGVTKGYLPFLPGAMCTTAMGRHNIKIAQSHIQEHHSGTLIYGDTDSCYIHFPHVPIEELWDFCLDIENKTKALFPEPIELLFEEAIYKRFFILTKKRYMAIKVGRDLVESKKLLSKGVVLTRRDNAGCIRHVYEDVVMGIMKKTMDKDQVQYFIIEQLNRVCSHYYPTNMYVVTKKIGALTDYATRLLAIDDDKRKKRLLELDIETDCTCVNVDDDGVFSGTCDTCKEYKYKTLPAHVLLAERMRARGLHIDAGERIGYIITDPFNYNGSVRDKIEDPDYQVATYPYTKIDPLYYVKLMGNTVDECLDIGYDLDKFLKSQYKARILKTKCCIELLDLFASIVR